MTAESVGKYLGHACSTVTYYRGKEGSAVPGKAAKREFIEPHKADKRYVRRTKAG
jgi:hypothetical protein